jgi:hypothetical protein
MERAAVQGKAQAHAGGTYGGRASQSCLRAARLWLGDDDAGRAPNAQLAKLAADWPAARLVEIWNSLPGETQVRKFKDRATAASRIWKAIQSLSNAAQQRKKRHP